MLNFFKKYRLPIVSGFLIGTSYIPFLPWASCFAFVPLWAFLFKNKNYKTAFVGTVTTGFLLTLIGFNWVAYTLKEFGDLPWLFALLGLALFCFFANLDIACAALTWLFFDKKLKWSPQYSILFLALITALFERHIPTIFSWNYGFTWYWAGLPMAQMAEWIGFQGISSLTILSNLFFYYAFCFYENKKARLQVLSFFTTAFLAMNGLGHILYKSVVPSDAEFKVLITQANIGNQEKQYSERGSGFRDHIVNRYVSLSYEEWNKSKPIDFMVWPETALPVEFTTPNAWPSVLEPVRQLIRSTSTPLISGGYGEDPIQLKTTNSFFIFNPDGQLEWPFYFKSILLVFGEYIPFSDRFPRLKDMFPAGDFARGPGPQTKKINELIIGPQICYESLFPDFTRQLVQQGAQVIVNITNDSWYGHWQEPYQHGYMTLGRSIEYRRPIVRSTNTGISTVALANGDILEKSPIGQEWAKTYTVPYMTNPKITFYAKFPWLIDVVLLILILALATIGWNARKKVISQ